MKTTYALLFSLFLISLGCPAEDPPPVKESLYSQLQNNDETILDAGSTDGAGEGTVEGSAEVDGGADGSADGSEATDAGTTINPGPGGGVDVALDFGTVAAGSVEIVMNSGVAIAGFQFSFSGAAIASHSGGIVEDLPSSWQVTTAANGTVLGFKFSSDGDIEPVNDVLMILSIGDAAENEFCISGVTVSDASGSPYTASPGTDENKCTPAP
jgi:hypothetical protein